MKKIVSLTLVMMLLFGCAACSNEKEDSQSSSNSSVEETLTETLVWSAPSTKKYMLNEKPLSEDLDLSITMCKNETEGVQLMVTPHENVTEYNVEIGDLTNGSNVISKENIGIYREH